MDTRSLAKFSSQDSEPAVKLRKTENSYFSE